MSNKKQEKDKPKLPGEDPRLHAISQSYRRKLMETIEIKPMENLKLQSRVNTEKLIRINGLGESYLDLLEEAGVDSMKELARRNADNLYDKLVAVNLRKKLVRRLPSKDRVKEWIKQAKKSRKVVKY